MKTTSLITARPTSSLEVVDLFQKTKDIILSGNENPIKIAVQLRGLEEVIKKLRTDKEIRDYTLEEALKEGGKTFKLFSAEITIKETGVKYDYSECNDSLLEELYKKIDDLKGQIKDRENMLKTITHDNPALSIEGEILNPPLKTSTTGLSIRLL